MTRQQSRQVRGRESARSKLRRTPRRNPAGALPPGFNVFTSKTIMRTFVEMAGPHAGTNRYERMKIYPWSPHRAVAPYQITLRDGYDRDTVLGYLRYFVESGLLGTRADLSAMDEIDYTKPQFWLSELATTDYPSWVSANLPFDTPIENVFDLMKDEVLADYINKFQASPWFIGWAGIGHELVLGHEAGEFTLLAQVSKHRESTWPSLNIQVHRTDYRGRQPRSPSERSLVEETNRVSFPHSPMEFMAFLQPFMDKYHP